MGLFCSTHSTFESFGVDSILVYISFTVAFSQSFQVVDAVEGPLEQTLESIRAVKDARVSMIVAINKIDKTRADIERCKKALYDAGVNVNFL